MDPKKIERINELARKKRTVGLTEGEVQEQAALRLSPEERLAILALERRHVEALRQEAERFLAENKED